MIETMQHWALVGFGFAWGVTSFAMVAYSLITIWKAVGILWLNPLPKDTKSGTP